MQQPLSGGATRWSDAPRGVDLIKAVVAIEHPRSDDPHVRSQGRRSEVTSRAGAKIGDVVDVDWLARRAAGLVARHDLNVQAALAAVLSIQHVRVARIRFHLEDHVAVGRVPDGCLIDSALEGGAGAEHSQTVGSPHTVPRVVLAGAASNSVRLCCSTHTGWRVRLAAATGRRRNEAEDKHEAD